MAYMISTRNCARSFQIVHPRRVRRTIGMGIMSAQDAGTTKTHIEHLVLCAQRQLPIAGQTMRWLLNLNEEQHAKLVDAGLCPPRVAPTDGAGAMSIGTMFDRYIVGRTDIKPNTKRNLEQSKKAAVEFFTAARRIDTITQGDAADWRRYLLKEKYAEATVAMFIKKTRQVFADAVSRRLISLNPFTGLKAGSQSNADRMEYVPAATVERVIEHCPHHEWKLLFAMARYAGVRIPSETLPLLWTDILWDQGKMRVRSPKTEHHKGRAFRWVPIFPELHPYLIAAHEAAPDGAVHVFVKLRGDNLATMADRFVVRAGVTPWEKTFQNLRSSCETDLTANFPLHVACAWIGNTEAVAIKHYLQVTDEHFATASGVRAAHGAEDNAGQCRTGAEPQTQKALKNRASAKTAYPQGASSVFRLPARNLQAAAHALNGALHRLNVPAEYRCDPLTSRASRRIRVPDEKSAPAAPSPHAPKSPPSPRAESRGA
jgi:integrase